MVTKKTRAVKNKRQVIMWILHFITPGSWKHQNKKSYGLLRLGCKSWHKRQLPVRESYFVFLTWCAVEASRKPVVWWWRSLQSLPDLSWANTLHGIQSNGRFNVSFMLIWEIRNLGNFTRSLLFLSAYKHNHCDIAKVCIAAVTDSSTQRKKMICSTLAIVEDL